jgi:hypothetical protein
LLAGCTTRRSRAGSAGPGGPRYADPLRYGRAAVRWLSRYTAEDRQFRLAEARELVDVLDAAGRHDQVAELRLERFLRARL